MKPAGLESTAISASVTRRLDASFFLFVLGGSIGLIQMISRPVPFGKGFEMVALATNLASHGTFANPFAALATGPSAYPPLYPAMLALLMKALPASILVLLAATVGNILTNAVTAALLPCISELFYGDNRPGIIAAIFWLADAQLIPAWDASLTQTSLLVFCLVSKAAVERTNQLFPCVGSGLIGGILLLLNPSSLLVILPWTGWLLVFRKDPLRAGTRVSLMLVTAVLSVTPWVLRNHLAFGGIVLRSQMGISLYVSNNDCARPSLLEAEENGCFLAHHPNTSVQEAQLTRDLGEVRYDHKRRDDSMAWIQSHRGRFLALCMARFRDFWFPPLEVGWFRSIIISLATLLSLPGLLLMAHRRVRVTTAFVGVVLFVYPLMYYIVIGDVRYRMPILWLSLLPAGYFLTHIAQLVFHRGLRTT